METSYIGCYWGDRQESASSGAATLATVLEGLADLDPLLSTWFKTGTTATPGQPVSTDAAALTSLLESGVNRTDFGNEVITRLGYSFDLWNGAAEDQAASLGGTVGIHAGKPGIVNSVVLDLPATFAPDARVFDLLVEAWDPDWATWTTRSLRRAQGRDFRQVVGWSTYLRSTGLGDAPAGASLQPLANGTLISADKPAVEVDAVDVVAVRDWLAALGALATAH